MLAASSGRVRLAAVAILASVVAGCDLSFDFDDGDTRVKGRARARQGGTTGALVVDPDAERRPLAVRRGEPVAIAFSADLDPAAAREAVRVQDESRRDAPVPVEVEVDGRVLRIRPRDAGGFRRGARLRVVVAGLPSVRALRDRGGRTLDEDVAFRVRVRGPRRLVRVSARIETVVPDPAGPPLDPGAHLDVVFSRPMAADGLVTGPDAEPPRHLRVEAGPAGAERAVTFRSILDREHRRLTLVPPAGGWPSGRLNLAFGLGVRSEAGGRLADDAPTAFGFEVGAADEVSPDWLLETFETDRVADAGGTTVAWGGVEAPGVLLGEVVARRLEVGPSRGAPAPEDRRFVRLDPDGGRLRFLLPAAELGPEAGRLEHLRLLGAPAHAAGEMLAPRVRVAPLGPGGLHPEADGAAPPDWVDVGGSAAAVPVLGADDALDLPFRRPVEYGGSTDLIVEVEWNGLTRGIVLAGEIADRVRTVAFDAAGRTMAVPIAPRAQVVRRGDRAAALSTWLDAGGPADWRPAVLRPDAPPGRVRVELQGAPAGAEDGAPDTDRATPWVERPERLAGMRWVRFRIVFDADPALPPAFVDDLALPFYRR